jgi:glycine/D-amino acid oxidase-like deaminating enzyme/nitrite reductase/ring-hydroxylating ferredoxin subunit
MTGRESYWIASTEDSNYVPLAGDVEVDVAVVGAGITGLTTALLLQQAGRSVVVLEAKSTIGRGVTGFTTGKVTAGQGLAYSRIERTHGERAAALYAASQSAAVELVATLAEEHAIDCDLERVTHSVFAERADEIPELQGEAEAAARAGLPVELVHDPDVAFPAIAALGLPGQVQLHARKYLLGLARAVVQAGGVVHQEARVETVEDGDARSIRLPGGTVTARDVVLATHVPFGSAGAFYARLEAHAAYAVGVPVEEGVVVDAWINVGTPTRSLRTTPLENGRRLLVVVGEGHVVGREEDPRRRYEALAQYVRRHLTAEPIAYRWSTQDQYPVDGLPYVGRVGGERDGRYVATGFAGWGLSNGTLAGMLLRDAILGNDNEWAEIYDPERRSAMRAPGSLVKQNLGVARQLVGGKLRSRAGSVEDVPPGSGEVLELDGEKAAVHRAEDGRVSAVSAVCTHMGCDVVWNPAESTWDCPCHGSRFATDGAVLEGPATRPLAPVEIEAPAPSV